MESPVLGRIAQQRGDLARSGELAEEAVRRLREHGTPADIALSLMECAIVASEIGDTAHVRNLIEEIESIGRTRAEPLFLIAGLHLRALVEMREGDIASAVRLLEQELAARRPVGGQQGFIKSLTILGHVRLDLGQKPAARALFDEAIRRARASGEIIRLVRALEGCARCMASSSPDAAVRLAGATDRQRQALGAVPWPSERRYLTDWLTRAREKLGRIAFERAWEDGHASTLDQAIGLATAFTAHQDTVPTATMDLTPREQEIAILLARGLTNKQVAAELIVSPATVRSHVEHILTKLNLSTRAQIAVWAAQHDLVKDTANR
jgi:non-specific serine/threonine protein kinase